MHKLLHWGDHLNWMPIACLAFAVVLVFLTRMLTIWFYTRTLRTIAGDKLSKAGWSLGWFSAVTAPALERLLGKIE
jgi:hypothetical protein